MITKTFYGRARATMWSIIEPYARTKNWTACAAAGRSYLAGLRDATTQEHRLDELKMLRDAFDHYLVQQGFDQ